MTHTPVRRFLNTLVVVLALAPPAFAQTPATPPSPAAPPPPPAATAWVPGGRIVAQEHDEFTVQPPRGTLIEFEISPVGKVTEVSGDAITGGDVLTPDQGLLSLQSLTESLTRAHHTPTGEWSLESGRNGRWHYEVDVLSGGARLDLEVDATTGQVLRSERDD